MGKGGNLEALDLGAAVSRPKRQPHGRLTQTAVAHRGEDKWLALGETRRAAATCKTTGGREELHPFSLAKGPDGTKGFKIHRTARGDSPVNAWGPERLWDAFWNRPISPAAFTLIMFSGLFIFLLVLVLFFRMTVAAAVLAWMVNQSDWLKRLCQRVLPLGLISGGLVLCCLAFVMGITLMGYTTTMLVELTEPQLKFLRLAVAAAVFAWAINWSNWLKGLCRHMLMLGLVSAGLILLCLVMDMGITLMGYTTAMLVELTEPQIRLTILGGATAFLSVIAAPEGGGSTGFPYENTNIIFSSHIPRSALPLAIHQEAGRLRRKVAATLFFKVFDRGGNSTTPEAVFASVSYCRATRSGLWITSLCNLPSRHIYAD